ncbi:precorrin-6y C5,15-methyltransferase (decarboxylating) subunit CbiE [Magnetovibrio sp.]|uniref:precorrin-6y C5,15-methyltransferase (decarboxylating) subunit CbiE n=1 Tax=Magnetovibrio sp. TaxID=2024836 RepID=UPI002F93F0D7
MNAGSVITVVGIGEDGLAGLSPAALALVDGAEVLIGGERHLQKAPDVNAERLDWSAGFDATLDEIEARLDRRIVVLASGDPLHFGVGATLIRRFGASRVAVVPAPGAVSLACARMGWSVPDVTVVTIHGRPLESLNLHLAPAARLVVLARDGDSPAEVAQLLTDQGFGPSRITVLEYLGGAREKRVEATADRWSHGTCADLATLAIECIAGPGARPLSRLAGLPDDAFEHDGQLTKREVRAVTLARLAPLPGEMLWDVGAGAGSIGIEWMRSARSCRAVAIERDPERAARIARNAHALGVPYLKIEQNEALTALKTLDGAPDAVFVGGGVAVPGLLQAAWARLKPGGRLVANAVTVEGAAELAKMNQEIHGDLIQIAISRQDNKVPKITLFENMRTVMQLMAVKPLETKND